MNPIQYNLNENTAISILNANGIAAEKSGNKISVICPFHNDKDFGNAYIYPDRNYLFKCYRGGCPVPKGASNIAGALKHKLNISFHKALEILQVETVSGLQSYVRPQILTETKNLIEPKQTLNPFYIKSNSTNFDPQDYYYTRLKYYTTEFMREFNVRKMHTGYYRDYYITNIGSKKLSIEASEFRKLNELESFQKFFDTDNSNLKELRTEFKDFKNHCGFKLHDYGKKLILNKNTDEIFYDDMLAFLLSPKVLYSTGTFTPHLLFDYDNLDFKKPLIVTEGVASIPLLRSVFKTKNVTATFTSNLSDRQFELLAQFENLIFLPDGDNASVDSLEIAREKLPQNFNVIPVSIKDDRIEFKAHLESFFVDGQIHTIPVITYISRMKQNLIKKTY